MLAGTPSFDPNATRARAARFNTATQGLYPPGSTIKTVTATAAIDSGRYQPDSKVSGKNGKVISGTPLNNFGSEDFGDITLTDALTNSVNTVWAEVGVKLGRDDGCRSTWTASGSGRTRRWTTPTTRWSSSGPQPQGRDPRR